jgi:hypothetical protein
MQSELAERLELNDEFPQTQKGYVERFDKSILKGKLVLVRKDRVLHVNIGQLLPATDSRYFGTMKHLIVTIPELPFQKGNCYCKVLHNSKIPGKCCL